MFLECQSAGLALVSRKGRYLGGEGRLRYCIYWNKFIMPGRSRWSLWGANGYCILGFKQASITLKNNLAASGGALGGSDHLYMLICFVSVAVSNGHASMTLRCLYYTCLLTVIGQDTNYILLAWVFPWPHF